MTNFEKAQPIRKFVLSRRRAYTLLGDAQDELRDYPPMSRAALAELDDAQRHIAAAKDALNRLANKIESSNG